MFLEVDFNANELFQKAFKLKYFFNVITDE